MVVVGMIGADGWSAQEDRIEQIRELHKPVVYHNGIDCEGCDADTFEAPAIWPCKTARLLYSQGEIDAAKKQRELENAAWRAKQRRSEGSLVFPDFVLETFYSAYMQPSPFIEMFKRDARPEE